MENDSVCCRWMRPKIAKTVVFVMRPCSCYVVLSCWDGENPKYRASVHNIPFMTTQRDKRKRAQQFFAMVAQEHGTEFDTLTSPILGPLVPLFWISGNPSLALRNTNLLTDCELGIGNFFHADGGTVIPGCHDIRCQ